MARNLAPDEAALWARVMETVRPLRVLAVGTPLSATPFAKPARAELVEGRPFYSQALKVKDGSSTSSGRAVGGANTLDGGWDRRLSRGLVAPDTTVDLHGHTLRSAHDLLDKALAQAIARGDRVVLLVTGKPPKPESERPHARGAIRAAVGDWIAASRHAGSVAAVRGAHPRHGGAGALYLILRRGR